MKGQEMRQDMCCGVMLLSSQFVHIIIARLMQAQAETLSWVAVQKSTSYARRKAVGARVCRMSVTVGA